ncbi:putative terminase small subunit [uncultured Caudovirales phage]|uniref:Putative terminase small subunit n=1 Tax=uncultured Caudovirales phage TaxID=2100421 RepID=A0A2I2MUI1_9CAUD|nr:putative terminase small subunit [uncultured Caudovirales phage]
MASRKSIDWESVESSYRVGSPSIRALADAHGLTEGAIRKRAAKEGWAGDLTEKVRIATKEKLVRTKVRSESTQRTDAEIVEDESEQRAGLVLAHRTGLANWRAIADKLSVALAEIDVNEENLGDFSRALNAGVDAQLKVIKGERQAYNLDAEEGDKTVDTLASLMDELSKDA